MILIRQVIHLSGTKLTEASANVFKYPGWNWKVLIKIFCGCQDVFTFFPTAWLEQSKSNELCMCTHKCEQPYGGKTNGKLQALTLCFCLDFITCYLCHWIPSISGPLLIYIFIIYTSVFTRCLLIAGQTANTEVKGIPFPEYMPEGCHQFQKLKV